MIINFNGNNGGGGSEYVLPAATATTLGGVKVGDNLSIDANGVLSANGGGSGTPHLYMELIWDGENNCWSQTEYSANYNTESLVSYLASNEGYLLNISLRNGDNETCAVAHPNFYFPDGYFRSVQPSSEIYFTFMAPASPSSTALSIWKYKFIPNYYHYGEKSTVTFVSATPIA